MPSATAAERWSCSGTVSLSSTLSESLIRSSISAICSCESATGVAVGVVIESSLGRCASSMPLTCGSSQPERPERRSAGTRTYRGALVADGLPSDGHAVAEILMVFVVAALSRAKMGEALDELDGLDPLDHLEAQLEFVAQP